MTFTNPLAWNFGAGPVPVSDAGLALNFLSYGLPQATNDLNLTLNRINVANYNPMADSSLAGAHSSTLGGGYATLRDRSIIKMPSVSPRGARRPRTRSRCAPSTLTEPTPVDPVLRRGSANQ